MKLKGLYILLSVMFLSIAVYAQDKEKDVTQKKQRFIVNGTVYSNETRQPIPNAQISSMDAERGALTDSLGRFTIELLNDRAILSVTAYKHNNGRVSVLRRNNINVYLQPSGSLSSAKGYDGVTGWKDFDKFVSAEQVLEEQDLGIGYSQADNAFSGKLAGLQVTSKGGMPGEGAYLNVRGTRSIVGENTPLIVIDGVPFLPGLDGSSAITGFSRSLFSSVAHKEIKRMTLLKGADALIYGSIGSNGVLVIETDKAMDMETKVEFHTTEGIAFMDKRLPLLNATQYKSYIGDIGVNKYPNLDDLVDRLPFLLDDPEDKRGLIYRNDTKWQDEIYRMAIQSDNQLKVKGGDAVAKYVLTLGTQQNQGVIKQSNLSKYYTRLNANINFSKRLKMNATGALNFTDLKLHEQGIARYTNPVLTSFYQAPCLSVRQQIYQNGGIIELPRFTPVDHELLFSNPAAVAEDIKAKNSSYDVLVNMGFDFEISKNWLLQGSFGLYYTHTKEDIFIPGKTSKAIAPLQDTLAENTVRSGVASGLNYYGRVQTSYAKNFRGLHDLNFVVGYQLMSSQKELDNASGINTPTDFYTTLGNVSTAHSRIITGVMDKWSWMNGFINFDYMLNNQLYIGAAITADAASSYGSNGNKLYLFPAIKTGWRMKNSLFKNWDALNDLTLRAAYSEQGNSRFSSKYGRYYYVAEPVRDVVGVFRNMVPNSFLKPERVQNVTLGVDFSTIGRVLDISVNVFEEKTKDLIVSRTASPTLGVLNVFDNVGEIRTRGVEADVMVNLFQKGNFKWTVGGNIAHYKSEVMKLGGDSEYVSKYDNGLQMITKVGESPYQFYGHKAEKVFTSTNEANSANYYAQNGRRFVAGDIKFYDANNDQVINDQDRVAIGDPTPDFYGGFYTNLRWKGLGLSASFSYAYGNEIYNGVRQTTEAMSDFANQSHTVQRRWMVEGQKTDIPRASYGDKVGNSRFSSRWIEDGSFIRMKDITLSYEINKRTLGFHGMMFYVTGENLFTWTDYLGLDPEVSYSYDRVLQGVDYGKVASPKSVKVGIKLNF
ncbi:MAG: SusC/RagA family TonB-linked outer membrane protein [Marinifilaceae bacterium]